ncbi:MAG: outer membrane beta-barrel family protein [Anditalea sp.]
MKPIILPLFSTIILLNLDLHAQNSHITGKVRDSETGRTLEFANVVLLNPEDSTVVDGSVTDQEGDFEISASYGRYLLRAGFIGYDQLFKQLEVDKASINLGNLRLSSTASSLEEVTVSGVISMFESDIDKRTYNVGNSIVADGATASDLLATLPSIQIDEEGGIAMRGSGSVLIYINGRPTNLSSEETESILSQFPANSIQSVELITNPSSRYDASGVGGIINIILKKEERLGLNGQVNVSLGTRNKYTGGLNLNYRTGKFNFYTSYNFQSRQLYEISESLRRTDEEGVSPFLDQDFNTDNTNQSHLLRGGVDVYINDRATMGIYGQYNRSSRDRLRIYHQRHQGPERQLDSLFVRTLEEDQAAINFESGITFDYDFDTVGQRLYASFSYARNQQDRVEYFDQLYYNQSSQEVPSKRQDQIYGRPQEGSLYIFQVDYEKPFPSGSKLEGGAKGTFDLNDRGQTFDQLDLNSGRYIQNDSIANQFTFDEYVTAAYGIYRHTVNALGFQVGLRAEQTTTKGYDFNSGTQYDNAYFNLFPSLYLTYELGPEEELLANYSRRINRPGAGQMAPFYNAQDLLNTRYGNPELNPEYTDSYETGYNKGWENYLFTGTLYHRRTTDVMTRIISLLENNSAVQLWTNANQRNSTGLELINQFQFSSNFDATLNGNFFYSELKGSNIQEGFDNSNFSWTISLLSNIVLPNIATVQIQGEYSGPIILPQGEIDPIYGLNVGLRRDIFNNRATVSLNVTDIFNTRIFRINTTDREFYQERYFNRETRIGTISLNYRFGGFRAKEEQPSGGNGYGDDPF